MSSQYHFGVVGENVSYSKSADIFKAAFARSGQSVSCDLLSIPPERLCEKVGMLKAGFYRGLSVTIPYKTEVISSLDTLDSSADRIQAVNSVCLKDGKLTGFNTDIDGFVYPLSSLADQTSVLMVGYGGAAKGVAYALTERLGFESIIVAGHSQDRLDKFKQRMESILSIDNIETVTFDRLDSLGMGDISLIVNCTPLGGPLIPDQSPFSEQFNWPKDAIYYDLNYNKENQIIVTAQQNGLKTIDGSSMLVAQALKSIEIWTGETFPFDPVYSAVFGKV